VGGPACESALSRGPFGRGKGGQRSGHVTVLPLSPSPPYHHHTSFSPPPLFSRRLFSPWGYAKGSASKDGLGRSSFWPCTRPLPTSMWEWSPAVGRKFSASPLTFFKLDLFSDIKIRKTVVI
jgi:hypothetical protein